MTETTTRIAVDVVRDNAYDHDRRKFVTQYMASAGRVSGWGKTQTDAKVALVESIGRVLDEFAEPTVLTLGDRTAIVYCYPDSFTRGIGWAYRIVGQTSCCHVGDRAGAIESACRSLAQDYAMGDFYDSDRIEEAVEWLTARGVTDPYDVARYCAWQRAAAHAHAEGIEDVHSWACHHQSEFTNRYERPEAA